LYGTQVVVTTTFMQHTVIIVSAMLLPLLNYIIIIIIITVNIQQSIIKCAMYYRTDKTLLDKKQVSRLQIREIIINSDLPKSNSSSWSENNSSKDIFVFVQCQ